MAEFNGNVKEIVTRLQAARVTLIREQPFYAVLLMHMRFAIDVATPTLYTDGERIAFNPEFVEELSDSELRFVLMHEVLHVALGHCNLYQRDMEHELFNVACDIVVNSNILYSHNMKTRYITVKGDICPHTLPDGDEGYLHTAEEVYAVLLENRAAIPKLFAGKSSPDEDVGDDGKGGGGKKAGKGTDSGDYGFDDHTMWKSDDNREENMKWVTRMVEATEIAQHMAEHFSNGVGGCGSAPYGALRRVKELVEAQLDWKTILNTFVQEEIVDYSFSPPDRRFEDSPFFLPDFNEPEETIKNIVFLVDTSGSMGEQALQQAYSEIKGAVDQFNGKMEGFIVPADTQTYEFIPFCDETDFLSILPRGGGGTDFYGPIRYVIEKTRDNPPSSIVYITDGYCSFPEESVTNGIPFLWLVTTDVTPPWGRVARLTV